MKDQEVAIVLHNAREAVHRMRSWNGDHYIFPSNVKFRIHPEFERELLGMTLQFEPGSPVWKVWGVPFELSPDVDPRSMELVMTIGGEG